jgi:hypothetical protein
MHSSRRGKNKERSLSNRTPASRAWGVVIVKVVGCRREAFVSGTDTSVAKTMPLRLHVFAVSGGSPSRNAPPCTSRESRSIPSLAFSSLQSNVSPGLREVQPLPSMQIFKNVNLSAHLTPVVSPLRRSLPRDSTNTDTQGKKWRARQESNLRHLRPERSALSAELRARSHPVWGSLYCPRSVSASTEPSFFASF